MLNFVLVEYTQSIVPFEVLALPDQKLAIFASLQKFFCLLSSQLAVKPSEEKFL